MFTDFFWKQNCGPRTPKHLQTIQITKSNYRKLLFSRSDPSSAGWVEEVWSCTKPTRFKSSPLGLNLGSYYVFSLLN